MLTVVGLNKRYNNGRGVFDIDFSVKKGEVLGLLGPNGAGKTTILKLITGLLNKDSGYTSVDSSSNGLTIEQEDDGYKNYVTGMVGDTVLYPYLTPLEHMTLATRYVENVTEGEIKRILTLVDLWSHKKEKVKVFSTGMKQRLAIAMCIAKNPEVLILDEPFSGLDIEGKLLVKEVITKLIESKEMAIIISSHLVHDIEPLVTKVAIINEGSIIKKERMTDIKKGHINLEDYFVKQIMQLKEGA